MKIASYREIRSIPNNYTYHSPKKRAHYFWTLLFGILTGDLNPIHINPFTSVNFKSRLSGLARHGISTLAQAESFIFKILTFTEPTEIIAKGYNNIRYLCPVNMGDKITYSYTLLRKKLFETKKYSECVWQITATNQNNKDIFIAEWVIIYAAIEKNIVKRDILLFYWFGPTIEIEDTPGKVFFMRVWTMACGGVIAWAFVHFSN